MFENSFRICSRKGPSVLSITTTLNTFKRTKMDLTGKSVIITGGINNLAYEMARVLLCKNVARLGLIGLRQHPRLESLAQEFPHTKTVYCKADVANEEQIKVSVDQIINKFQGCLDIYINNTSHVLEKNYVLNVKINLLGTIYGTLNALKYMDKSKGGRGGAIVNISSIFGLEPCPPIATYSASKHGVVSWTRCMADECYQLRTCVNHICCCPCLTAEERRFMRKAVTYPGCEKKVDMISSIPAPTNSEHAIGIVEAIEEDKNGSIWIIDRKAKEVEPVSFWGIRSEEEKRRKKKKNHPSRKKN